MTTGVEVKAEDDDEGEEEEEEEEKEEEEEGGESDRVFKRRPFVTCIIAIYVVFLFCGLWFVFCLLWVDLISFSRFLSPAVLV